MKRPPRMRQPHHEHPALQALPGDGRPELAEVDLRLSARQVGLRDRDLHPRQPELGPAAGHIPRHRHLRHDRAVLGDQPLPDPPRGMTLLTRHVPVRQQRAINNRHPRTMTVTEGDILSALLELPMTRMSRMRVRSVVRRMAFGSWESMAADGEAEDDDFARPIRAPRMKPGPRFCW
jgi:hypothetical protein